MHRIDPKLLTDRIYSLYKISAQPKMSTERTCDKQKQSLHTGLPFIPEMPAWARLVSRLKPHWVLGRDRVEEITNSLQAIQMVMDNTWRCLLVHGNIFSVDSLNSAIANHEYMKCFAV